jgi:hypothetical protein
VLETISNGHDEARHLPRPFCRLDDLFNRIECNRILECAEVAGIATFRGSENCAAKNLT